MHPLVDQKHLTFMTMCNLKARNMADVTRASYITSAAGRCDQVKAYCQVRLFCSRLHAKGSAWDEAHPKPTTIRRCRLPNIALPALLQIYTNQKRLCIVICDLRVAGTRHDDRDLCSNPAHPACRRPPSISSLCTLLCSL